MWAVGADISRFLFCIKFTGVSETSKYEGFPWKRINTCDKEIEIFNELKSM